MLRLGDSTNQSALNNSSGGHCMAVKGPSAPDDRRNQVKQQEQKSPEVGQDLADIVTAGAEDGEDRVADAAFQRASRQATIALHVPDLRLDGASSPEELCQKRGDAASRAADQDLGGLHAMAAIAAVDHSQIRHLVGQDGDLLQCGCQGVAVVWVVGKAAGADDEASVEGGGKADLGAEFVTNARLALGDAIDLRLMERVDLVLALRRLLEQATDQPECFQHPSA